MTNRFTAKNIRQIFALSTIGHKSKNAIVEIIALLFVILFLYTAISKLLDHSVFKQQLAQSPVLKPIAPFIAWGIPIVEILVSNMLFFPVTRLQGLYASITLMVIFTCYIIVILTLSEELPCSCGGVLEQLSWPAHLVFNIVFIALGVAGIVWKKQN